LSKTKSIGSGSDPEIQAGKYFTLKKFNLLGLIILLDPDDTYRIVRYPADTGYRTDIWYISSGGQSVGFKYKPNCNRNRRLKISTALTKAKSRKLAYSQALVQNKIDRQLVRSRDSGRQANSQTAMVDGVLS